MSAKQKQHITKPQRSYFHTMLNMADDELGVYEYRLLGHYVRVAGDGGACWESTRTTAQKCRMSVGKVVSTRRALQTAGYVTIEERGDDTLYIELVDRWAENIARYAGKCSPHEHDVHHMNGNVHDMNQRRTIEEEPVINVAPQADAKTTPRKPKKDAIPAERMTPMKDAIATAFGWDWKRMTRAEIGQVQAAARQLCEAQRTPEDVATIYRYCKSQGWNGGFTPGALVSHASEALRLAVVSKRTAPSPDLFKLPEGVTGFGMSEFVRTVGDE